MCLDFELYLKLLYDFLGVFFSEGDIVTCKIPGGVWWPGYISNTNPLECCFWDEDSP